ncbi:MAG: DNA cytosine methyltransferase [Oscillospiraceae bacterium]|nr:DNA cytosine methyltransferase [Oscillospiraceae bacterium]MCL2277909.1 DNA cytosine methyltransferase [Oscillospiraceae bacterium]
MKNIPLHNELIIDNFAGGGGASTGIELATGRPVDIAINHDPEAIEMHKRNHPYTRHYCENVWKVDPKEVTSGQRVALVWLSPDCTHFSKARGGKPRKKEIRGLAWIAVRWAASVKPRVIVLENVEEFKDWGPLCKQGKSIVSKKGQTFRNFISALEMYGYQIELKELRAYDYGAPTMRKRLFMIARCDNAPIVWPQPSHGAPDSNAVKLGKLKLWRTAAEIIDWTIPCPSIFATSEQIRQQYGVRAVRPLAENTLRRIARGIKKFVLDNPNPFIVAIGQCEPISTVVSSCKQYLVAPTLIQYHDEQGKDETRGQSPENPLLTVDTENRYGVVMSFLSKYYSGGYDGKGNSVTEPLSTVTSIDHNALVTSHLTLFRNNSIGQDLRKPLNTILTSAGHFGEVRTLLIKYYGGDDAQDITAPAHTITPKDRLGLVTVHGQQYAITDIGLRMLTPRELFNAQGFPPDYVIDAGALGSPISKAAQIARCGNAVPPPFSEAIVRANLPELCGKKITTMSKLIEEMAG